MKRKLKHKPLVWIAKQDRPTFMWVAKMRVCRGCDNLTLHYQVSFMGHYRWLCSRQFNALCRKGKIRMES